MDDIEFWNLLSHRVSSELSQFEDDQLRFLWCDGFISDYIPEQYSEGFYLIGHAWIGDGSKMEKWPFKLFLGTKRTSQVEIDWLKLLPREDETEWLEIDQKEKTLAIIPPVLDPRTGH